MKKVLKNCGYVLAYGAAYIIVSFLLDLTTGDNIAEFDWVDKLTTGLLAGVMILCLNIYMEKHNLK